MKRKLKITITKIQRIRVSDQTFQKLEFCPICQDFVEVVGSDENRIKSWLAENQQIHQILTGDGNFYLCKKSF